ncbi:MAG: DUF1796 family putative cysteine peptidase [Acidobacteriaceae bacterium]|nr:DUF1796 family putative cysteine peptidase [Acidobacteriaceae bacterium]
MKRNTFVSLGFNCEAAYQFRRVNGDDQASFFSWTYCKFNPLLGLIKADFDGVLLWENVKKLGLMVHDHAFDVSFHGEVFNNTRDGADVELAKALLADMQSKFRYLAERWRHTVSTAGLTTYFLKIKHNDPNAPDARRAAVELRDLLRMKYPAHEFRIVVLQSLESVEREPQWDEDRIFNRYLQRYAADVDPENDAFTSSWDAIFAEFPVQQTRPEPVEVATPAVVTPPPATSAAPRLPALLRRWFPAAILRTR